MQFQFSTLVNKVRWPSGLPRFTYQRTGKGIVREKDSGPPKQTLSWGLLKINSFHFVTGAKLNAFLSPGEQSSGTKQPSVDAKSQPRHVQV